MSRLWNTLFNSSNNLESSNLESSNLESSNNLESINLSNYLNRNNSYTNMIRNDSITGSILVYLDENQEQENQSLLIRENLLSINETTNLVNEINNIMSRIILDESNNNNTINNYIVDLSIINNRELFIPSSEIINLINRDIISEEDLEKNSIKIETKYECSICFDEKEKGILLNCEHIFCEECIKIWIKKKNNCPICRKKIK